MDNVLDLIIKDYIGFEDNNNKLFGRKDATGNNYKKNPDSSDDEIKSALQTCEVVVGQPPMHLIQEPKKNCPELKLTQMTWAGADIYTRSSMSFPEGITLANASGAYGMIMSQFVIGMTLLLLAGLI